MRTRLDIYVFIAFLSTVELELMIYHTRGEHANNCTTDVVQGFYEFLINVAYLTRAILMDMLLDITITCSVDYKVLSSLSTICQLYRDGEFYLWMKQGHV